MSKTLEELKAEKAALQKKIADADTLKAQESERKALESEVKKLQKQARPKGKLSKALGGVVDGAKKANAFLDKLDQVPEKKKVKKN